MFCSFLSASIRHSCQQPTASVLLSVQLLLLMNVKEASTNTELPSYYYRGSVHWRAGMRAVASPSSSYNNVYARLLFTDLLCVSRHCCIASSSSRRNQLSPQLQRRSSRRRTTVHCAELECGIEAHIMYGNLMDIDVRQGLLSWLA